ncbi:polysaccharide biosynthesis/export family protein [Edaphobacter aggregans]|uniref:polysaccharide biosynthesis/export family protein n=1 Tax=Edaphobacter aggregans TaxID=570835 RepID=UPI00146FD8F9|nr:polysaccharide biosynthesis/export family protein [Edaphobacter aggregans]
MYITRSIALATSILLAFAPSIPGQETPVRPNPAPPAQIPVESHATSPDVILESGDLLTVSVAGAPEYRYEVRVSSEGSISLPMLGNVKVAGLSTLLAERTVAQRLQEKGFFNDPQVSIFVKEYATAGISVLGEVLKPGIYPLPGNRTLLDAISAGGGLTPKAGKSVTITHRDGKDNPETVPLSRDNGQTMTNMAVQPGDTIVVSKAGMVYVVGDVKEPTGIIMDNPHLTVLQAVAMAHGTNPTAKLKSARLIHKANSSPQDTPIPLDKILAAKSPDLELQPDDVVFVPNSVAKAVTRRTLEAALQAATGIAIWGRY